jgi:transposase
MAIFSDGRPAVYTIKHGAIKSSDFSAFIASLGLGSTDTLLMDNASIHNRASASTAAQVLRTPPYSPECNPIELAFARIKYSFRCDFHEATTRLRMERAVASLEPASCPALFQHVSVVVRDPAWVAQST